MMRNDNRNHGAGGVCGMSHLLSRLLPHLLSHLLSRLSINEIRSECNRDNVSWVQWTTHLLDGLFLTGRQVQMVCPTSRYSDSLDWAIQPGQHQTHMKRYTWNQRLSCACNGREYILWLVGSNQEDIWCLKRKYKKGDSLASVADNISITYSIKSTVKLKYQVCASAWEGKRRINIFKKDQYAVHNFLNSYFIKIRSLFPGLKSFFFSRIRPGHGYAVYTVLSSTLHLGTCFGSMW